MAEANYFYKNSSIYFKEGVPLEELEKFAIHEFIHYIQEVKDQKGNSHFLEFSGDDAAEIRKNQSNPAKVKETIIKIRNKYNS